MNDYLWDKTGEPEEDVRQLEELLGGLRHRPAPLRLPAAPPAAGLKYRPFRPAYAIAAALALAALAGLWFAVTKDRAARTPHTAATNARATETATRTETPARVEPPTTRNEARNEAERVRDESATGADETSVLPAVSRRQFVRVSAKPPSRQASGRASAAKQRGRRGEPNAAPRREQPLARTAPPAPTREQQAAKEQLMFALRLTSAKLGDVKRKASGAQQQQRPSASEQNKLR